RGHHRQQYDDADRPPPRGVHLGLLPPAARCEIPFRRPSPRLVIPPTPPHPGGASGTCAAYARESRRTAHRGPLPAAVNGGSRSMKLTVVGCSGSFPSPDSACSSYLVEADGYRLLLDMGNGALGALQRHCGLYDLDAVALSHLHADHCIDMCG